MDSAETSPLGKKSFYSECYDPRLLFVLPRSQNRQLIGIGHPLPFKGCDVWNAYELSWLNQKGKPVVAVGNFVFPCESPFLIESKSLKLYLNSLNNTSFASLTEVKEVLIRDLTRAVGMPVQVEITLLDQMAAPLILAGLEGVCLDALEVECEHYQPEISYLSVFEEVVTEILYSHLLKSNCLVTHQPDWGSVQIAYTGRQICHSGLLKYIVSFRQHNEFHEACVERIFIDIMQRCNPSELTVYARYTRRGGLDINPFRSTLLTHPAHNHRLIRQ